MPWFAMPHQIINAPSTLDVCVELGWDIDTFIGRWTRLIFWAIDYCENGALSIHAPARIATAMGVEASAGEKIIKAFINSGLLIGSDMRIAGWWDLMGRFFQTKYKSKPEKWKSIKNLYAAESEGENFPQAPDGNDGVEPAQTPVYNTTPNTIVQNITGEESIQTVQSREHNTQSDASAKDNINPGSISKINDNCDSNPISVSINANIDASIPVKPSIEQHIRDNNAIKVAGKPYFESNNADRAFLKWYWSQANMIDTTNRGRENAYRIWNDGPEKRERGFRALAVKPGSEEREMILTRVKELSGKVITWWEYLTKVIEITVLQSAVECLDNPTGFAIELSKNPERVVNNYSTGVSI